LSAIESLAQSLTQAAAAILALIRQYPGVPLHLIERDFHDIFIQIPRSLAVLAERKLIVYRVEFVEDAEKGYVEVLKFYPR
jgi:hypothetical protein